MGVHGLWDLLSPVGRRVSVETLAGKKLAIDASIWMVQFMKAMRDEKGEMIRNAHLVGFFRRICKLLFLRTKPVFVFDGGTPALKRRTVIARRRQRENAQMKIRKTAEKLLLNQLKTMRLKELQEDLQNQRQNNDAKGKKISVDDNVKRKGKGKAIIDEQNVNTSSANYNQEALDELLAASIAAEENDTPLQVEDEDDDEEEMLLPAMHGPVDPAVLAALPPSMQLDLLGQMRERLMAENRQKYQKVKKAPERFSELQIQSYLKTVAFRREIREVQKSAAGKGIGGIQTSRIASEANREFIFSSNFTGDKQLLTSGGEGSSGTHQTQTPRPNVPSNALFNHPKESSSQEDSRRVLSSDDVETYKDERGRIRVSRVRAMGIRMTRDLQRNLDLIKEIEEGENVNSDVIKSGSHIEQKSGDNVDDDELFARLVAGESINEQDSGVNVMKSGTHIEQESGDDDELFGRLVSGESVDNSRPLDYPVEEESDSVLKSGSHIEISFETNAEEKTGEEDDELFARLVAGESIDNSRSMEESESAIKSGTHIEISFETNTEEKTGEEDDDELFARLVSGESINIDNSRPLDQSLEESDSDCEWEEGIIEEKGNNDDAKMMSAVDADDICDDSGPHWEEGIVEEKVASLRNDDATMMSAIDTEVASLGNDDARMMSAMDVGDISDESGPHWEEGSTSALNQASLGTTEPHSKGTLEEEAEFQEAIRRSIEDLENADMADKDGLASNINHADVADNVLGKNLNEGTKTSSDISKEELSNSTFTSFKQKELNSNYDVNVGPTNAGLEEELLVLDKEYKELGDEQRRLERNAESVTSEMFSECQELLQMFGLPYIVAPMEAEAQCAFLELSNIVDGVVTDDSDAFLFGAKSVFKNIFDERKYVETYFMKDIENELGLDRDKLIRMALLLGSDYTEGVSGIGIVNAVEVMSAFPEENGLKTFREWIESPDPLILGKFNALEESEEIEQGDEILKIKRTFMEKHRNVSKNWHIPGTFPSEAVTLAYASPQVDKSTAPFVWGKPDLSALRKMCWEKFGWGNQKAEEVLLPVLKEYNKHETQLRLEAFYTFNEKFAKIRSKRIKSTIKGIKGNKSLDQIDDSIEQDVPKSKKKRKTNKPEAEKSEPGDDEDKVTISRKQSNKRKSGPEANEGNSKPADQVKSRGKRKRVKSSLRSDESSSSDGLNIEKEEFVESHQVRRSERSRKAVNYSIDDDLNEADHVKIGDEGFNPLHEAPLEAPLEVPLEKDDNYLNMGGGFCMEDENEGSKDKSTDDLIEEDESGPTCIVNDEKTDTVRSLRAMPNLRKRKKK